MAYRAYDYMGAHIEKDEAGKLTTVFRVWAPNARQVWVYGDFCGWNTAAALPLKKRWDGIWEGHMEALPEFTRYKYRIETREAAFVDKCDPYGFHMETRPATASKIYDLSGYEWGDEAWLGHRREHPVYSSAVNIYELHFASWRRYPDGNFFDYRKMADELVAYLTEMGYTHVEFMPLSEYPFDRSWGYQVLGYYAPTSRFGTPKDLMYLVDRLHQAGIGCLLDWVPAHFPKDEAGLASFDGDAEYEYADPRKGEHLSWGTKVFDYSKPQVLDFLISNALYWLNVYHFDGLRVDAVASMLYLDYDRKKGEWVPNIYGGNEHLEAVHFLKELNTAVFEEHPDVMMIAEESTAWPKVTAPVYDGGLGFNYKWNMGWMHDVLAYIGTDPLYRHDHQNQITFSFSYAYSENYILPLSHDEVVYGKCSLINKNPGSYENKFAGLKTLIGYMMTHPGKKMLFMGGEIAQFDEWDHDGVIEWNLLDYDKHRKYQQFIKDINHYYRKTPALYELDSDSKGFSWISGEDHNGNIITFYRTDKKGRNVVCVLNFAPVAHENYRVGVPERGYWKQVLCSDSVCYGGSGSDIKNSVKTEDVGWNGKEVSLNLSIAPLSVSIFECTKHIKGEKHDA